MMEENHSENLERDFFSFFYSALFSYLFFLLYAAGKRNLSRARGRKPQRWVSQSEIEGDH